MLLFDEPASSLDPELLGEVLRVIRQLAEEERTMLLVTHEPGFACRFATRIIFLADGAFHEVGTPDAVLKNRKRNADARFSTVLRSSPSELANPGNLKNEEVRKMNAVTASNTSSQGYVADDRNNDVLIYVNGEFFRRDEAKVSVFDAGFVLGDGVWEGVRLVNGKIVALDEHLDRLYEGANSIQLDIGMSRDELTTALRLTFEKNRMTGGAHARLMVTRGKKKTPNQDPRFALGQATVVIIAEFKLPKPDSKTKGLSLLTSAIRCSTPDVFDLRLNSHSRLNFIHALIQAINSGADEALMLDPHGFVASCNSTNFFIVRGQELWTSTGRYNFNGITRKKVIKLYADAGYVVRQQDFTLAEVYGATEAFVTGTLGGITPVTRVDGRQVGNGQPGLVTRQISDLYDAYISG